MVGPLWHIMSQFTNNWNIPAGRLLLLTFLIVTAQFSAVFVVVYKATRFQTILHN